MQKLSTGPRARARAGVKCSWREACKAADSVLEHFGDPKRDRGIWVWYCQRIGLCTFLELALTGKRVETEMFSMYLTVRGGFAKTTEKWNPAKHSLHLVINLKGALKEKMADISVNGASKGEFSFGGPKDGSLDGYVEIEEIPFAAGDTVKVTVHPDPEKTEYVQEDSSFAATAE